MCRKENNNDIVNENNYQMTWSLKVKLYLRHYYSWDIYIFCDKY